MKHMNNRYESFKIVKLQMFADDPDNTEAESDEDKQSHSESSTEAENQHGKTPESKDGDTKENDATTEKKYTDADLDRIIGKRFARWQAEQEKAVNAAKEEAAKLAKMNAEQRKEYELEKAKNENEKLANRVKDLEKEALRSELARSAAKIMKERHSIVATQDMLDFVVGEDAEQTSKLIEKLVGIITEDRKQVETVRATGRTPRSYSNNGDVLSEIDKRIAKYK